MNIIEKIRVEERDELARVLKKHTGIRKIVEDLYPDSAHFIYELLQNAEDAEAKDVTFTLHNNKLIFEHNGRPFDEKDILAITDIGEGTKADDNDKIGRFGIGFKAVFAYSETPHIWSPTFSFKITDLVLPFELSPINSKKTKFEFPFNNHKKSQEDAFEEIKDGLNELEETTLLFLNNIETISWKILSETSGEVLRTKHSPNHIEILKQINGKTTESSHFLKFDAPVKGLEKQKVAIAFPLDFLAGVKEFNANNDLSNQVKIVVAEPANVSVFFPAKKEISGLRFHLHAPFVPELSRASIKNTPANDSLYEQLADLTAQSLHRIKDLNLLNTDFLNVLPNGDDDISDKYEVIREKIIDKMNNEALTPTFCRTHYPAKYLLQGDRKLKDLLSNEDMEFLFDYDEQPPLWVMSSRQRSDNADKFLNSLQIKKWDKEDLIKTLTAKYTKNEIEETSKEWLSKKTNEWLQNFYAFLYEIVEKDYSSLWQLKKCKIIKLTDGNFNSENECFFYNEERKQNTYPTVEPKTYSLGKNQAEQKNAKLFLEKMGVREFGEKEYIECFLKERYWIGNRFSKIEDIKIFIDFLEKNPDETDLFEESYIILCENGKWRKIEQLYIDSPYEETNLSAFYSAFEGHNLHKISNKYLKLKIEKEKLVDFFKNVGVKTELAIEKQEDKSLQRNLVWSCSGRVTDYESFQDWHIPNLEKVLGEKEINVSKLIWNTLKNNDSSFSKDYWWYQNIVEASYKPNGSVDPRMAESTLIKVLKNNEWIPQENETKEISFVTPNKAFSDLLPKGFSYDKGDNFLLAINFGFNAKREPTKEELEEEEKSKKQIEEKLKLLEQKKEKEEAAKKLGFKDIASAERARRFAELPEEEQERILAEKEEDDNFELPEDEPLNPERRRERVRAQASSAPERTFEKRTRSVSTNREDVKKEAKNYLISQYTNPDGKMICQICQKELPFKLKDGNYYFETTEFLRSDLEKRHYQNYLALCPNHSAMFCHANDSDDLILEMFKEIEGNELEVVLADKDMKIYFTKKHIADIKAVIEADTEKDKESEV
ncbi:MAG: sacsin N-terminal ATP-binding-like domain-containing protein [Alphaproteobacteria bacterium]